MDSTTYYKVVRLKTGESIICSMDRDVRSLSSENFLKLNEPVQVVQMKETTKGNMVVGENYLLRPWMGLSDSDEFMINTDVVLTIGDLKEQVREQYVNYIEHTHETKKRQEDDKAIFKLLKEVNPGNDIYIINDDMIYGDDNE